MSCLLLAFSSVWLYTVSQASSDVLLCSLAERVDSPPHFVFGFLKDPGVAVLCSPCTLHCLVFSAWFLSHGIFSAPLWFTLWRCDRHLHLVAVLQDVPGSIGFAVTSLTFHSAPAHCFPSCHQNFGPMLVMQVSTVDGTGLIPLPLHD